MQKYRFDKEGQPEANGSIPLFALWMGGPSLAGVRNCPTSLANVGPRTVYVTGEPDTYFSIPAVCSIQGKRVRGYLVCEADVGGYQFRPCYY